MFAVVVAVVSSTRFSSFSILGSLSPSICRPNTKLTNILSGSLHRNETDEATKKLVRIVMIFMISMIYA